MSKKRSAREKILHELEKNLFLITEMEARQAELIKANALETERLRAAVQEHGEMNAATDERIANLIRALGEITTQLVMKNKQS